MMDFERYMSFKARIQAPEDTQPAIKYPYTEIVEKEGKGGKSPIVVQKSAAALGRRDSQFGEYAIVSRDRINVKGETEGTELEIQSETMQKALHSIFGKHYQVGIHADPIIFRKPYYSLFHCRHKIRELVEEESNTPEQKQHLDWLTNFMSENFKPLEKVQEGLVDKGLVEFKHLPIIFEAGSIVIGQINEDTFGTVKRDKMMKTKRPECYVFHEISDELEDKSTGGKYVEIKAFRWGFNGSMFGLTEQTLHVKGFPGPRRITELECFPLKYLEENDKNALVPKLIARGERWCDYVEHKNLDYNGVAQVPKRSTWSWDLKIFQKNMPGRVILDHLAFVEAFPELNSPLHNKEREPEEDNMQTTEEPPDPADVWKISSQIELPRGGLWTCPDKKDYKPTPAQALLCPASSPGYSLAQKDWGYFDIDQLKDVKWAPNPIKGLEIDPIQKEMLKDLIMEHHSKAWSDDTVPGKGDGLIFLLYGPPGCGKTLTAELMAEEDKRALIRISCSDLGQHPYEIERALAALLTLALRASTIVLIDEADAFLAKRSIGGGIRDYLHNAIVSIFLKHLEYFPGVIFLTTNQETEFDEAVSSRVVRLRYGPLNAKGRAKIWKNQLLKGGDFQAGDDIDVICEELGNGYELDGREIKNLAQLSLAICRRRKQKASKEIIQQMYTLTHGTR